MTQRAMMRMMWMLYFVTAAIIIYAFFNHRFLALSGCLIIINTALNRAYYHRYPKN